jgi:hypothetical protein
MVGRRSSPAIFVATLGLVSLLGGCQNGADFSSRKLIAHQALIDFSGLDAVKSYDEVSIAMAAPRRWIGLPFGTNPLYAHKQWRSPSGHTGVGVVCAHLPLPLSTGAVVWLAKQEYVKQGKGGKLLGEWTDSLGRSWFEAENDRYHVRGYVCVKGFTAWIVYFGYRTKYPPDVAEISLAARSAETVVPGGRSSAPTTLPAIVAQADR